MASQFVYNRELPSRSMLEFLFPNSNGGTPTRVMLPFFENISLTESKAARYQDFKLFGRSSDLYGYMGADSRKFELSFSLTFPHIQYEHPEYNLDKVISEKSSPAIGPSSDTLPKVPNSNSKSNKTQAGTYTQNYLNKRKEDYSGIKARHTSEYKQQFQGNYSPQINLNAGLLGLATTTATTAAKSFASEINVTSKIGSINDITQFPTQKATVAELMLYWTNIVRASVVNDSKNPVLGPPLIRLTHGILYQDVPCICKNYSFSIEENSTYDLFTLMPQILTFKLSLEELRAGDFGEYKKHAVIKRDNLAGYEAIFTSDRSMDPGQLLQDKSG